jgi:hypothetical protein
MRSQLQIASNLMPDEPGNRPHYRFLPGDLAADIYRGFAGDFHPTPRQQREHLQYIRCFLCGRTCAGTCGKYPEVR